MCGFRATPHTFLSTGNRLRLRFLTDRSVAHEGFDVSVVTTPAVLGCESLVFRCCLHAPMR